jgi:hypothetical protein
LMRVCNSIDILQDSFTLRNTLVNMSTACFNIKSWAFLPHGVFMCLSSDFCSSGGIVVSMLASVTQIRGFKPGRSRRIFRAKKSSACLPSEVK